MFSGVRSISNRMRIGFAFLLVMALGFAAPLSASAAAADTVPAVITARAANIVSAIAMLPRSPNVILVNQKISITFHYDTTAVSGVIVTAAPFTGSAVTASATTCKTAVLPVGKGTGTCAISVGAGPVNVSGILFRMWDSLQKTILFQALVPVSYQVGNAANLVSSLIFTPATPNDVAIGKGVGIKYTYRTDQAAGVTIFVVPYTGTAVTPNAFTCAATIHPMGSGIGSCRFSVASGAVNVTSVHVQMWDAPHTKMLVEEVLPVMYHFRSGATLLAPVSVPQSPNIFRLGNTITVHFDYQTSVKGGIIVVVKPFTGTTATANATLGQSLLLPTGSGKGSATFMLSNVPVTVTSLWIQAWDSTKKISLFGVFMPVNYQFK